MKRAAWILSVPVLFLLLPGGTAAAGDNAAGAPGGAPAPIQTPLGIRDVKTGETKPLMLLGGEAGTRVVKGTRVRLYVLQADSAKRFATPGAPTHVLTVALQDDKSGKMVEGAAVTLRIAGKGVEADVPLQEFKEKFYQGKARMAGAGPYRIEARFKSPTRSGSAAFDFDVKPPGAGEGRQEHGN